MESHLSLYLYFRVYLGELFIYLLIIIIINDLITLERSLISHSLLVLLKHNPQYGLERVWGILHLAVHYPD